MSETISPTEAAKALGRLGGLATKGIKSQRKTESGRHNAAKAREALAKKREQTRISDSLQSVTPTN